MSEKNKEIVRGFMKHFSANDLKTALGMMSDDATWWVAGNFPLSGTKAKAQFAELLGQIGGAVPGGIHLTPKVTGSPSKTESSAEHTNGKKYKNQYHFLFEVRHGKIRAVREYLDTMHANDVFCT